MTEQLIGDLVGSGVSAIASLFGADSASRNVRATNRANKEIAAANNQTAIDIANRNNAAQLSAMRENNAFNKQSAIDMFNMEAAYNDPKAQKQRLLDAGINPATLYGAGSASAGSASASTPSAASSGITPSTPSLTTPVMQTEPSVINTMFGNMETVSRIASNLTKAGLDLAQKDKLKLMLSHELDNLVADTANKKLQASFQQMQNNFETIFGYAKRNGELAKLANESYKLYQEGVKAGLDGDLSKSEKLLRDAQTELSKSQNKQLQEQLPFIKQQMEEQIGLIQEQQRTEKSKQSSNYASANASNASADLTKEQRYQLEDAHNAIVKLHELRASGQKISNDTAERQLYILRNSLGAFIRSNWAKSALDRKQVELIEKELEKLQKDIDWQDEDHFFNNLNSLMSTFKDATGTVLNLGTLGFFGK